MWHAGAAGRCGTAGDEIILAAAAEVGLLLVTLDVRTIQPLADHWIAAGRAFPGVVMIVGTGIAPADIGGIARGLAALYWEPGLVDPAYPVVYLRPLPESRGGKGTDR